MRSILIPVLAGAVSCAPPQPAAHAGMGELDSFPLSAASPLMIDGDEGESVNPALATRVLDIAQWVMERGPRVVSTAPPGREIACEQDGYKFTARAFNHDNGFWPDILAVQEPGRRGCTDFGLDGAVNDCQVYGEVDPRLFSDPQWRSRFPSSVPSIGTEDPNQRVVGESNRLDHQLWFEYNIGVLERCRDTSLVE